MNSRSARFYMILPIAMTLLLGGCLGGSKTARPDVQVRAESLISRGIKAEVNMDTAGAERLFSESLALSSSIEDSNSMVRALVNRARLYRLSKKLKKSEESIDAAIMLLQTVSEYYSETAHEKALVELAKGDPAAAEKWAEKAVSTEQGSSMGRRLNLLCRIKLQGGDKTGLSGLLRKALSENRGTNGEEEANTLRMLAIVNRNEKGYSGAEELFDKALSIDKKIGVSSKIATDLEELGQTSRMAGKPERAVLFYQRAYLVNLGGGRTHRAAANQSELAALFSQMGDRGNAEKANKTARELSEKSIGQTDGKSAETTKPSSNP